MSFISEMFGPPDIEKLRTKRDAQGLIKALKYQKDKTIRKTAAEALSELKDIRAVEPLIAVLEDSDDEVCRVATEALVKIGSPAVDPLIHTLREGSGKARRAAAEALVKIGSPSVKPLIAILEDEKSNGTVRAVATNMLVEIGSPAVEPLILTLREGGWRAQRQAVEVLGKLKDVRAIDSLAAILGGSKDTMLRKAAVETLGKLEDAHAIEPLIAALGDLTDDVSHAAVVALKKFKDARAIELLVAALNENWRGRAEAAEVLGELKDARAVEPLIAALEDSDGRVCKAAAKALGQIRDTRASQALLAALARSDATNEIEEIAKALDQIVDAQTIRPLMAILENRDDKTLADEYRHEKAKNNLGKILEHNAANVTPDDLRMIANLKDRTRIVRTQTRWWEGEDGLQVTEASVAVDYSHFRRLAHQELIRRGLEGD